MIDKEFCMSSYLAFRYIERENVEFYEGFKHRNYTPISNADRVFVLDELDIDRSLRQQFNELNSEKLGILLSGGMDSAILASYMQGCDAYTFRFCGGTIAEGELKRAEYYAKQYNLNLHYVDIDWKTVENYTDLVMENKCSPVHSIEPQILQGALQAQEDGITMMVVGESSDLIFGGMDKLLAKDWTLSDFEKRYTFLDPKSVLNNPVEMHYLYERYRMGEHIDFMRFMDDVFAIESSSSYMNAFETAGMRYIDPYAKLKMKQKLDLHRVRNGESKYLIRKLFANKYPDYPIPEKVPMPRPVDTYFADWKGPVRYEFKKNLDMNAFTGNQKWQLYCLERFLNIYEPLA